MNNSTVFRHEYKYLISDAQRLLLQARLPAILDPDPHVHRQGPYRGLYNIRSVYFDDLGQTCYYENENGTDPREKFRIRIYNHSDSIIKLELKSKIRGKCLKKSCPLSRELTEQLLRGDPVALREDMPELLKKLLVQIRTRGFRPSAIVEYDRVPYICKLGNVRVTLDTGIRSSTQFSRFFEPDLLLRPVLPTGQSILEVKWDELLPDHIYRSLMLGDLQWTSFSKFYICKKFTT